MVRAAGHICSGPAWVWSGKEGGAEGFAFTGNKILMVDVCLGADHVPGRDGAVLHASDHPFTLGGTGWVLLLCPFCG